jgi:hypothetical protein
VKKHQADILDFAQAKLGRVVAAAGRASGVQLEIRSSACRAFVSRLQRELAFPLLVPGQKEPTRLEVRLLTEDLAARTIDGVYQPRAVATVLQHLPVSRRMPAREPVHGVPNGVELRRHSAA